MIIRLRVKNFLSFHDEVEFCMIPGQGRLKQEHKSKPIGGYSVLKTSAVYGANAGGKSNLVKAIAFLKYMVLQGTRPDSLIDYHKFLLSKEARENNSKLEIEFQSENKNYDYGIEFNNEGIVNEWLYEFTKRSENLIYERKGNQFTLDGLLKRNKSDESRQYLQFFAQSTPNNQLFLHEVFTRNIKDNVNDISDLTSVINWFLYTLKIIFPGTGYKHGVMLQAADDVELQRFYAVLLRYFDTGIDSIKLHEVDIEKLGIPQALLRDIKSDLLKSNGKDAYGALSFEDELYMVSAENGVVKTKKLITIHKMIDGGKNDIAMFSLSNESDGTKRLFDYIPLILDLMKGSKVFVVDEIERSLHPSLVYQIFKLFLDSCESIDSQLIVTSHETTLMTQNLLRKDEIWFMEKNTEGESKLVSLEEYKVRFDKELRGSYLDGSFGGVPKFRDEEFKALLQRNISDQSTICQE